MLGDNRGKLECEPQDSERKVALRTISATDRRRVVVEVR
jgi:hypothetical protein